MLPDRQYQYHQAWLLAFFSPALYRDVAQNWRGPGFAYLTLLLAACWLPLAYMIMGGLIYFKGHVFEDFFRQMPDIVVVEGELFTDRSPFEFPSKDSPFLIIDAKDTYSTIKETSAGILISNTTVSIQDPRGRHADVGVFDIPKHLNLSLNGTALLKLLSPLLDGVIFLTYPLMLGLSFLYRLCQCALYAVVGFCIFLPICGFEMGYKAVLRLAIVATTPAIIISTVLSVMHVYIPHEYTFYFLLSLAYLCFGIRANRCYALM